MVATSKARRLSPDECEKSWRFPPELDGWHIAHNSIKFDMSTFAEAVAALKKTLAAGQPLAAWQVAAVKTFWGRFGTNVEDHHAHEEDFFFPWMLERIPEVEKVSADHNTLLALKTELDGLVVDIEAGAGVDASKAILRDVEPKFAKFQRVMTAHLDEEEAVIVPALRRNFTEQEERQVTAALVQHVGKYEVSAGIWHLSPDERLAFMTRMGIPRLLQWFVFIPRTKQYDRLFQRGVKHVIAGTPPPPSTGWFWFWFW